MDGNSSPRILSDILIVAAALIVPDLIGNLAHINFLPWYKPVPSFVIVLAVIFVCTVYAKINEGFYSFGPVFRYGMKVSACASLIVAIYTYFSLRFFFPGLKEMTIEQVRLTLSERSDLPADSMDTAMSMANRMFTSLAVFGSMVSLILTAVIGALISYFFSRPFLRGRDEEI